MMQYNQNMKRKTSKNNLIHKFIENSGITKQEFEMLMEILEQVYIKRLNVKKEEKN